MCNNVLNTDLVYGGFHQETVAGRRLIPAQTGSVHPTEPLIYLLQDSTALEFGYRLCVEQEDSQRSTLKPDEPELVAEVLCVWMWREP